jgi:hypothetical protein
MLAASARRNIGGDRLSLRLMAGLAVRDTFTGCTVSYHAGHYIWGPSSGSAQRSLLLVRRQVELHFWIRGQPLSDS